MNIGERIADKIEAFLANNSYLMNSLGQVEREKLKRIINREVAEENTEDSERLDWLDKHCAFVADHEYKIGPYKIGELRKMADEGIAIDAARGKTLGNETPASTDSVAEEEKSVKADNTDAVHSMPREETDHACS